MPRRGDLRKIMVIGSGPIIIGQAAEFDYAGTQACRALKDEGLEVVLVNSNPATIMTDANIADRVYVEPLLPEYLEEIIAKERPDGLLATLGGQVGLNLAVKLAERGTLEKYNVELLGTPLLAIRKAEDRELFKQTGGIAERSQGLSHRGPGGQIDHRHLRDFAQERNRPAGAGINFDNIKLPLVNYILYIDDTLDR